MVAGHRRFSSGFVGLMLAAPLAAAVSAVIASEPYTHGARIRRDGGPRRAPPKPDINGPCTYRPTGSKRSRRRQAAKLTRPLPLIGETM